jgi:hypothetical protein
MPALTPGGSPAHAPVLALDEDEDAEDPPAPVAALEPLAEGLLSSDPHAGSARLAAVAPKTRRKRRRSFIVKNP